jgi:hypothetical protein
MHWFPSFQCPWPLNTDLNFIGFSDVIRHTEYKILKEERKQEKKKKKKEDATDVTNKNDGADFPEVDVENVMLTFRIPSMMSPLRRTPRREAFDSNYPVCVDRNVAVFKNVASSVGKTVEKSVDSKKAAEPNVTQSNVAMAKVVVDQVTIL